MFPKSFDCFSMHLFAQIHPWHTWVLGSVCCWLLMCDSIQPVNWARWYCWFLRKCPKLFEQGNNKELAVNYGTLLIPQEYLCLHENVFIQEQPLPNHLCKQNHVSLNIHEQQGAQTRLNQAAAWNSDNHLVNTALQYLTSSRCCCKQEHKWAETLTGLTADEKESNRWYIYILVKSPCV